MKEVNPIPTSLTKLLEPKLRRLNNCSPRCPGTVLEHQISFLGHWGHELETEAGEGYHALRKAQPCRPKNFSALKLKKLWYYDGAILRFCSNFFCQKL